MMTTEARVLECEAVVRKTRSRLGGAQGNLTRARRKGEPAYIARAEAKAREVQQAHDQAMQDLRDARAAHQQTAEQPRLTGA